MRKLAQLYFDRGRHPDALALADRIAALGERADEDTHFFRGQVLDALGRGEDALAAYRRPAKVIQSCSGVLLSDANKLVTQGKHAAARLLFKPIVRAGYGTGLAPTTNA
jgi:tetratricopeptide (TPR) repeat protein